MPRFRPRISLLSALLLMTILGMAIVIVQLWREVEPLRAENKRLNEERGTLMIGDPDRLHAIKIPARFAGEGRESFRVYVPKGQTYIAFVQVNEIPNARVPKRNLPDYAFGVLGGSQGRLYGRLDAGRHVVTVRTIRRGGRVDIALDIDSLDVSANTTKDQWPTATPETYTGFGGGVDATVAVEETEPLVLLRKRIMAVALPTVHVSYVIETPEPDFPLDGVLCWLERAQ